MKTSGRDASVDRLLPAVLKADAAEPSAAGCLDAETLAAWADDALSARERADAEAHAATCARCQMMLAAMVRSEPPVATPAPMKSRALWWIAALAPVAAAVVVWFAVPERAPVQQSQSADASVDTVQPAPVPPSTVAAPRAAVSAPPPAEARAQAQKEPPESDVSAAPAQKTLAKDLDAAPSANATADARAPMAAPAEAGAAPAAPAASNLRRETFAAAARSSPSANELERQIVSSNPSTRFRLLRGGGVQRSADGGATWRNEVTGATETLTAGSSPSPSVCWLAGPAGAVFLSTDGRSWRRLPFPETVDLAEVVATDAENATVRTADGRLFATTDGGRTWAPPDF
jgi:hypothetical protein